MTATAIQTAVSCPVCGGEMYDNRGTKKNPKQPDFKCKRYKEGCEGVIWPPKGPKPSNFVRPKAISHGHPGFLENQEAEDAAELAQKIAPEKQKLTELYLKATEFVLGQIVPKFEEKEIGMSDTAVVAAIATLFIAASKER